MQQLPLLFSFREIVVGDGFLAGVRVCGRALLEEADETWITGIQPVGFAGGGMDRTVAFAEFRRAWTEILFDIANDATSFSAFKAECEEFLGSSSASMTADWEAALEEVRRTRFVDHSLKSTPANEQKVSFEVVELTGRKLKPNANVPESGLKTAA